MDDGQTRFSRLSRRGFIGGVAASAAAAILAACGGSSATSTPAAKPTTAPAAPAEQHRPPHQPPRRPHPAAATTAPASSAAAAAATKPAAASAVTGTTAPSASAVVSGTAAPSGSAVASSGVAGTIPPPSPDKFKGQTLNMISRNEYFKSSEQALDGSLQDWAKQLGVKINNDRVNVDTGDFATKVDAAVKAGNPPDLVYVDRFLSQFVQLGDLTDMADLVAQAQQATARWRMPPTSTSKIDNKWWCLPYFANGGGWFARKDWLAEKGMKPDRFQDLRAGAGCRARHLGSVQESLRLGYDHQHRR